jgi:hypothetical protein
LAEGAAEGAGERHARDDASLHRPNTSDANTLDIAIMGALLSVPFLAMPAMGTVCISPPATARR